MGFYRIKQAYFWTRFRLYLKRKWTKDEMILRNKDQWGIRHRLADSKGHTTLVTNSGQLLSPRREMRREAERAGMVKSGRQWHKLRKWMRREEKAQ